ncbi:single-stranded DNA-binding protein [Staphylococcus equorum]|uniref:Single-stranded DNA-binding protein n=1 Tax=Staphylococcus equorum TaxID=246432 RepID=A0A9X4L119_9STAP|nr:MULTISPECIES: single-stranded DNA-binding protein [Staphylococcus]MDG0818803.1 single-stranded DNA-binding protein [Staphylococcus equorum]MDG0839444.1 single-stranded DNA-binding protein [Staphylococcus equorum]MDG0844830.1 single-stranded DNA-binding protein [Staphylococcus equorum]
MINSVALSGRLAKEVKYQVTTSGVQVARFTLAVQRSFKDKNGEYQADFINIIAFRGTAQIANDRLNKGDLCNIHGRMQSRQFENNEGQMVYLTEVVTDDIQLINTGRNNEETQQQNNFNNQQPQQQRGQAQNNQSQGNQAPNSPQGNPFSNSNGNGPIDIQDDDLPF